MKNEPKLLSRVEFASFLIYSPRGKSDISIQSRKVRDAIKLDTPGKIDAIVKRLSQYQSDFPGWFGPEVTVVPVPRSSPFPKGPFIKPENTLWISKQICLALIKHGLAGSMIPCLERTHVIKKSAYSARGERPSVLEQFESIACSPTLIPGKRILLVDDVITKGRTIFAAASRVTEVFPSLPVQCFALLRTMGFVSEIERIIDCCTGAIEFKNGDVNRNP